MRDWCLALDLFAGCGGLTTGLKQAGFDVIGAIELDDLAVETYRQNHPEIIVWHGDIRNVPAYEVQTAFALSPGDLDLLAGCPPCQGFSSIRTRNATEAVEDSRNDLVLEFLRFVDALRPKAVMMENVPGLIRDDRMTIFRARMLELGYIGDVVILDAADYGVPQRRRRLLALFTNGLELAPAERADVRLSVRDAIDDVPSAGTSGDPLHDVVEKRSAHVLRIINNVPKDGGSRSFLPDDLVLKCHRDFDGFGDVYGRMKWDDVAPTITGGFVNPSKGRFLHPEENRTITPREAALLQTFPADYHFSTRRGKFAVAEMIGNALPPEFIRRHAEPIRWAVLRG